MFDIEINVANRYHLSTMHPREYIDASALNVWFAILNNSKRKRSETPPRRFFASVNVMVIISSFNSYKYLKIYQH